MDDKTSKTYKVLIEHTFQEYDKGWGSWWVPYFLD